MFTIHFGVLLFLETPIYIPEHWITNKECEFYISSYGTTTGSVNIVNILPNWPVSDWTMTDALLGMVHFLRRC